MLAQIEGLKRIKAAIDLLRNERLRGFRVDIEVDSTLYGDSQQEKADRVQFITTVTQFLQQAMMMSSQVPEIAPLLGKFLQFGVRGFHVGRDLETAIEDFSDQAVKLAKQKAEAAKQAPNPQLISAQADMVKAQTTAQSSKSKDQREDKKLALDAQGKQADLQRDAVEAHAEVQRQAVETQGEQATAQSNIQIKNMEVAMKQMDMRIAQMREQFEMMKMQRMQDESINKSLAENP
jgi:hypothetical protein